MPNKNMIDKINALVNLLKNLSWVKVGELTLLIVVLIAAMTFYENRQRVYESIGAGAFSYHYPQISVSEKSAAEMTEVVNRSSVILGMQVVEVNFVKNTRTTKFFVADDSQLKKNFEIYLATKVTDAPALTTLEPDNNRLVRLVNGEFVCIPYKDTIAITIIGPADNVGMVCSMSIPPIYGKFRGYITAFIAKDLRPTELAQIRIVLQSIAMNIYEGK